MNKETHILIAAKNIGKTDFFLKGLAEEDFDIIIRWVKSRDKFIKYLHEFIPDIVIYNHKIPPSEDSEILELIKKHNPKDHAILISNVATEDIINEILKIEEMTNTGKDNLQRPVQPILNTLEKCREKEILFRSLLENIPAKVFLKDKNSTYLLCNQNFANSLRIKAEEIKGKTDYNFFPAHLAKKYRKDDKRVMESDKIENIEENYICTSDDGESPQKICVNTIKVPVRDDKGIVNGILGFFWDITQSKHAKKLLEESENRYRNIFMSSRDAVVTIEPPSWKFTTGNPSTMKMFKLKDDAELITSDPWKLSPKLQPDGRLSNEKAKELIETAMREGTAFFEWMHKRTDGQVFPTEVLLSKVELNGDSFLHAVIRDITERKNIEQENKRIESLKASAEIKEKFTSIVSHELRTPLAIIKESISLIKNGIAGQVNEDQKKFLEIGIRNIEQLNRLINNILDFQKTESGKRVYEIHDYDIKKIIQECVQEFKLLQKSEKVNFRIEFEDPLPIIKFDRDAIIQVFMNFITNALKFTEKGSITISARQRNSEILVKVQDCGPGIKAEDIPRLFHPCDQLEPTRDRAKGGVGLGLAISKEIILAHAGRIWVESEVGKGSAFNFTLPVNR